ERVDDQPFGFASQNFYPEFLAALEIYDNPERYFPGVRKEAPMEISRRKLARSISANELARRLGLSMDALAEVNYALHSSVWQGRAAIPAGYTLNVPIAYQTQLASLSLGPESHPSSSASSGTTGENIYRVRSGDSLGS